MLARRRERERENGVGQLAHCNRKWKCALFPRVFQTRRSNRTGVCYPYTERRERERERERERDIHTQREKERPLLVMLMMMTREKGC